MQTSGEIRREIAKPYPRHPERSDLSAEALAKAEAIHCHLIRGKMDCFASLAMTPQNPREPQRHHQRGEGCQPVACLIVLIVLTYIS